MGELDNGGIDSGGCTAKAPFALQVLGDDMEPEFKHGAVIIVDPEVPLHHGAYVVIDYQGETTFRQFIVREDKHYIVATKNGEEVEVTDNYILRGVVTQQARNRKLGLKKAKHYV